MESDRINFETRSWGLINLNRTLGALIREMHGQQLGVLIAKSVEKMCASLNQE